MTTIDEYDNAGYKYLNISKEEFWKSEELAEIERDNFILNPIKVNDGIYTCGKCKSSKVVSIAKQVRSSDEGMSVFCTCVNCNNSWREE